MKNLFLFLFLLVVFTSKAQDNRVSGLNSRQFTKYWKVESESPDYKVTFQGDTAEIVSPKGLTLWRKEKMSGKVTIEYDACVVVESDGDRLSDLNCFWMASDPQYPDNLWKREKWRSGIFLNCYSYSFTIWDMVAIITLLHVSVVMMGMSRVLQILKPVLLF